MKGWGICGENYGEICIIWLFYKTRMDRGIIKINMGSKVEI
jgi:hypothetical protein